MSARFAVGTVFFLNGAMLATWAVRVPAVQEGIGLGTGALGIALLGLALGALVVMPLTGFVIARVGSRAVVRASTLAMCGVLVLPALASDTWTLLAALFFVGAANGSLDVSMNAQGAAVEGRLGRPIMSSLHALFSIGGMAGSVVGGLAAATGLGPLLHFALLGGICALAALVAGARLQGADLATNVERSLGGVPRAAGAAPLLLALGTIAFCSMLGEGAVFDWSAVYLRSLGADAWLAAAGYTSFSLAMAAARLAGDRLTQRIGPRPLVRASGLLAGGGLAASLALAQPVAALAGFAAIGLGLALVVPLVFSAAARVPGTAAGPAIAAVTTTGYLGFLAGPPAIGLIAEAFGLPAALALVVVGCLVITALSNLVEAD